MMVFTVFQAPLERNHILDLHIYLQANMHNYTWILITRWKLWTTKKKWKWKQKKNDDRKEMFGGSKSSLLDFGFQNNKWGRREKDRKNVILETSWEKGNNAFKLNELVFLYVHVIDSIVVCVAASAYSVRTTIIERLDHTKMNTCTHTHTPPRCVKEWKIGIKCVCVCPKLTHFMNNLFIVTGSI